MYCCINALCWYGSVCNDDTQDRIFTRRLQQQRLSTTTSQVVDCIGHQQDLGAVTFIVEVPVEHVPLVQSLLDCGVRCCTTPGTSQQPPVTALLARVTFSRTLLHYYICREITGACTDTAAETMMHTLHAAPRDEPLEQLRAALTSLASSADAGLPALRFANACLGFAAWAHRQVPLAMESRAFPTPDAAAPAVAEQQQLQMFSTDMALHAVLAYSLLALTHAAPALPADSDVVACMQAILAAFASSPLCISPGRLALAVAAAAVLAGAALSGVAQAIRTCVVVPPGSWGDAALAALTGEHRIPAVMAALQHALQQPCSRGMSRAALAVHAAACSSAVVEASALRDATYWLLTQCRAIALPVQRSLHRFEAHDTSETSVNAACDAAQGVLSAAHPCDVSTPTVRR